MDDWHATRLAGWFVNTLGKALLLGAVLPLIGGLVAAVTGDGTWLTVGAVAVPFVIGGMFYLADAPAPTDESDYEGRAA